MMRQPVERIQAGTVSDKAQSEYSSLSFALTGLGNLAETLTHGLRRGLYSFAASRLDPLGLAASSPLLG